jgi:hypothetical protein
VEDYEVFTRTLSIGPQTMVMRFEPSQHGHYRYVVDHEFLAPELEREVATISGSSTRSSAGSSTRARRS